MGLFLGTAIGDALGMPVEGHSLKRIRDAHGKLTNYVSCKGHKWFDGQPMGGWTDDTHLTLAVARALIEDKQFTLMGQVKHHVRALETNDTGWGPTTKESIKKLAQGVGPRESGIYTPPDASGKNARGVGNGVCMKTAPLAAYFHAVGLTGTKKLCGWSTAHSCMANWTAMTHPSSVAVSSCFAMFCTTLYCLQATPDELRRHLFDLLNFVQALDKMVRKDLGAMQGTQQGPYHAGVGVRVASGTGGVVDGLDAVVITQEVGESEGQRVEAVRLAAVEVLDDLFLGAGLHERLKPLR